MPTLTCRYDDLSALLGETLTVDELEERLLLVKGEIKEYDEAAREIKIEINDTNRPDLWCAEGIARQLACHRRGELDAYPFFDLPPEGAGADHGEPNKIIVDAGLARIRPFVGAFIARGAAVTEDILVQMIQTQEKLAENLGRRRASVAIGIYNAAKITFPVLYRAVDPDETAFVPLGFDEEMSLNRILAEHPKGIEYAALLEGLDRYPFLVDSADGVLSFPPIINSRWSGEVKVGDDEFFVEATGPDLKTLVLALNILAANFADRGAAIEHVAVELPYDSPFGRTVSVPRPLAQPVRVDLEQFRRSLGEAVEGEEIVERLNAYGCRVEGDEGKGFSVAAPAFRNDYMHPVDVIEDFAISRGYGSFEATMPDAFTVGKLDATTALSDAARDRMIGFGYEEILSNVLTSRADVVEKMGLPAEAELVALENALSEKHAVLRSSVLPSLLGVEAASGTALYPHRLFEVGEVVLLDGADPSGCVTRVNLAALIAQAEASFSDIHSILDFLLYYLNMEGRLQATEHPTFISGRAARIQVAGRDVGLIGEIHPEVLERWEIGAPCAAFEIGLDLLKGPEGGS